MRTLYLDKIASVTRNCRLGRDCKVSDEFPCREGDVVAARILNRKTTYNQLELVTGRFSVLKPGDVIAGVLGHRRALNGYAGRTPDELGVGQSIQLLNLGGVMGICESANPDVGAPFECEVMGQVLSFPYLGERIGVPASIVDHAQPTAETLDLGGVPVVAVVGTCMNSGKSAACNVIIQELSRSRRRVHAAKATGVSLLRDILGMEDAGAQETMTFTDLGIVTTTRQTAPSATRSLLTTLARSKPDVIVLELGDGLMGDYGVDAILEAPDLREAFSAVVFAASDPVGAWGGLEQLRRLYEIEPTVVTGPATDNAAGTEVIRERMKVAAWNARTEPQQLTEAIMSQIEVAQRGVQA